MNFTYSTHQISGLPSALNTWQDEYYKWNFAYPYVKFKCSKKTWLRRQIQWPLSLLQVMNQRIKELISLSINRTIN